MRMQWCDACRDVSAARTHTIERTEIKYRLADYVREITDQSHLIEGSLGAPECRKEERPCHNFTDE